MEQLLDSKEIDVIYYHKGRRWADFPIVSRILLVGALFALPFTLPHIALSIIGLFLGFGSYLVILLTVKSAYKIYPDHIEFFNKISPKNAEILHLEEVTRADYNNVSVKGRDIYLKLSMKSNPQFSMTDDDNKVKLALRANVSYDHIERIIRNFESKGIPVFNMFGKKIHLN